MVVLLIMQGCGELSGVFRQIAQGECAGWEAGRVGTWARSMQHQALPHEGISIPGCDLHAERQKHQNDQVIFVTYACLALSCRSEA